MSTPALRSSLSFWQKYPGGAGAGPCSTTLIFLALLALFTIAVTLLAGPGVVSTSFVKTLGKTLCFCLAAIAMDLVWALRASCRWGTWRSLRWAATWSACG